MPRTIHTLLLILVLVPALLFGAAGDVPLSTTLEAPMRAIYSVTAASSGDDYLVVFRHEFGVFWQRVALDGEPIDPRPRRIEMARSLSYNPEVIWNGQAYTIFLHDGNGILQMRISRSGEHNLSTLGPLGRVMSAMSHGGETALITAGLAPSTQTFTLLDQEGRISRQVTTAGSQSFGLFRTIHGWRSLQTIIENHRQLGYGVFDPETGALLFPLPGVQGSLKAEASSSGGILFFASYQGGAQVIDAEENVHQIPGLGESSGLILMSGHEAGWTVLHVVSGNQKMTSVGPDGTIRESQSVQWPVGPGQTGHATLVSSSPSRHMRLAPISFGIEMVEIDGATTRAHANLAIGPASQMVARIARSPGLDLVVWLESAASGWTVRATRIAGGRPLDGAGLLLGAAQAPGLAATFDGEAFLVSWVEVSRSVSLRRVAVDGTLLEKREVTGAAIDSSSIGLNLASRGDGAALLNWKTESLDIAGALVIRGVPGPVIVPLFPGELPVTTASASFSGDSFLMAGGHLFSCQITCVPGIEIRVWSRILNPDGTPSGASVLLTEGVQALPSIPLPREGGWIVPILDSVGQLLIETTSAGVPYRELRTLGERIIETSEGVLAWSRSFRGLIDHQIRPDWFEPLPIVTGEGNGGPLSEGAFFLVRTADRYSIRPAPPHALRADLGISIDRSREVGTRIERVRIEHQGGDVIPAIHIGIGGGRRYNNSSATTQAPEVISERPVMDGRVELEGPFSPGDSVDIEVRWSVMASEDLFIWALPEARDEDAEDNFVTLPAVERRRLVGRGGE